jgi:hypothetical protein
MNASEVEQNQAQTRDHVQYDCKDPSTHQIRYYDLLSSVFKNMQSMNEPELVGAAKVMGPIADFLTRFHFEQHGVLNQKSFVKTMEEIAENIHEDLYHMNQIKSPTKEE